MTGAKKYENLTKYLKRKDCQYKMCKSWLEDPDKFIKWFDAQATDMKDPKMVRLSKEFIYSPDNFIILDDGEDDLCKAITNPVSIAHDPISQRYGYVDYKEELFISFPTKEDAEVERRKHTQKRVDNYIKKIPAFEQRLKLYKEMKGKHDETRN